MTRYVKQVKTQEFLHNKLYGTTGVNVKNLKQTENFIHKAVVRPILTYTAETRADGVDTKQILETAGMEQHLSILFVLYLPHKGNSGRIVAVKRLHTNN